MKATTHTDFAPQLSPLPGYRKYLLEHTYRNPSWWQIIALIIRKLALNAVFINYVGFMLSILVLGHRYATYLALARGFISWHANLYAWLAPFIDGAHWPVVAATIPVYLVSYAGVMVITTML